MSSIADDAAVFEWLCALETRVVILEAEKADVEAADRIRIDKLEAEIAELSAKVSAVEAAERCGGCFDRLAKLSTYARDVCGRCIDQLEKLGNRMRDVETLKQEKGKRLKSLEDDVAVMKGEAAGWKRARGSAGGF